VGYFYRVIPVSKQIFLEDEGRFHQRDQRVIWVCLFAGLCSSSAYRNGTINFLELALVFFAPPIISACLGFKNYAKFATAATLLTLFSCFSNLINGISLGSAVTFSALAIFASGTGALYLGKKLGLEQPDLSVALGIALLISELVNFLTSTSENPWKYGLGIPTSFLVLSLLDRFYTPKWLSVVTLAALISISIACDSRTLTAVTTVMFVSRLFKNLGNSQIRFRPLILILTTATLIYLVYPFVALSGAIGLRAQLQEESFQTSHTNELIAARLELPMTTLLAVHNLPLGIGANGKVNGHQTDEALQSINDLIKPLNVNEVAYLTGEGVSEVGYNAHSVLGSLFLFFGIPGLVSGIIFLWSQGLAILLRLRNLKAGLHAPIFLGIMSMWDLFFSPLIPAVEMQFGFLIALNLYANSNGKPLSALENSQEARGMR
jgi:hypothetical protein